MSTSHTLGTTGLMRSFTTASSSAPSVSTRSRAPTSALSADGMPRKTERCRAARRMASPKSRSRLLSC
eukprot:2224923-Alexandrium_andersonii.AAC.1